MTTSGWIAKVLVFSGREDPRWSLSQTQVEKLIALWKTLPPASAEMPSISSLGYRGALIVDGDGNPWHAFSGLVERTEKNQRNTRSDIERVFERAIIASAPNGLLPANLIG